ncbi:MAG: SDR family NAD(P)-dependent oxidoreductase, partial [Tagaea sp.]
MRLKNKTAIVTGGGSGFGEGIAATFAREGAKVLVADIDMAAATRVADAIAKAGGTAKPWRADVAKAADTNAMIAAAIDGFGRLDILVNNAGISHRNGPMLGVDEATVDRVFAVNVK